ncbi:iron ABC transporter permease [Paenibacillus sp. HWE-109]|uniref:iron ABC transporter permease n=1 Tax=Paenibacillus sp. HWE-109 TaxID=1306526 RepID=UPI001EDF89DC|nr:iron ABC transporter permease [Paenibacillus sp. HWE-109]UKS31339.1 iron ABC transporter permease [Paenibacillus sp. HWE-109]
MTQPIEIATKSRARSTWKKIAVFGGGLVSLTLLFFISLTQGEADITFQDVIGSLLAAGDQQSQHVVLGMRLSRATMGVLAGAALAVAGVLLQTVTKNPLASAGTFGINAGAYFVIVAATVFVPSLVLSVPLLLALIGGLGGAMIAYFLAGGRKGTPVRLALAGMIVTMALASFTSALQLLFENETNGLFMWGSGSLVQNDWKGVQFSWPWIALALMVLMFFVRTLDLLELDEETARSLGQKVGVVRLSALIIAILLASVAVSVVGPIGFVGLIAPHLVRLIGYRRHLVLIPAAALWGASVVVGADAVAKLVRSTIGELPVGTVTAVLGAPWLIWLAVRSTRSPKSGETGSSMSVGTARFRWHYPVLIAGAFVLLIALLVFGLTQGSLKVPVGEVIKVLTGTGLDMYQNIILKLRLPRMLVAVLAGAGLAISGVLLQGAVRNPLADPSVIGVTSGAGVGALLLIVVWPGAAGFLLPVFALAGAALAAAAVYTLSWRKGLHPTVVTLVGIAITAMGSAIIHFLVIKSQMHAASALAWLAGSTYGRGWGEFLWMSAGLIVLGPYAWYLGRRIDLLSFSDNTSLGLGLRLRQTRLIAAMAGVGLAALAVTTVGTVGFIGLLAPHAARTMVGQNHKRLVVLAAMLGAILMIAADVVGRVIIAPKEIPAGLVVAVIGTPYLLWLMARSAKAKSY